jgi:transposase-like protein
MDSNTLLTIDLYLSFKTKYRDSENMMAGRAVHQARLTISKPTLEDAEAILQTFEQEAEKIPYSMSVEALAKEVSTWAKMDIPIEAVTEQVKILEIDSKTNKGIKLYAIRLEDAIDLQDKWFLKLIE